MKKTWIILCVLGIVFSIPYFISLKEKLEEPTYCRYVDKISESYISYAMREHGLVCYMKGGALLNQVNGVFLSFEKKGEKLGIDEARVFLLKRVEELLDRINAHEKVRPYLSHYPFTNEGIELAVSFYEDRNQRVSEGYIARVSIVNGKIFYSKYDHQQEKLITIHKETFEEAERIVKGNNPS